MDLQQAMKRYDVSPIIKQFGTWAVTKYGVECLVQYYPIEKARLLEQDWIDQVCGKAWVNPGDFTAAYNHALKHFRKKPPRQRKAMSARLRFDVMKRDKYTCQICGRSKKDGAVLHVDHIRPVARGGTNDKANLQTLCAECNLGKGTKSL